MPYPDDMIKKNLLVLLDMQIDRSRRLADGPSCTLTRQYRGSTASVV